MRAIDTRVQQTPCVRVQEAPFSRPNVRRRRYLAVLGGHHLAAHMCAANTMMPCPADTMWQTNCVSQTPCCRVQQTRHDRPNVCRRHHVVLTSRHQLAAPKCVPQTLCCCVQQTHRLAVQLCAADSIVPCSADMWSSTCVPLTPCCRVQQTPICRRHFRCRHTVAVFSRHH